MQKSYQIAGHCFSICGEHLLPAVESMAGFAPFETDTSTPSFSFIESDDVPHHTEIQYTFRHEGVNAVFGRHSSGHLLTMTPEDEPSLHLWSNDGEDMVKVTGNFSVRILNYALWVGYGLMTVPRKTVAIHSSCIVKDGGAVLFLGESGTGKSTHTRLWREHIEGAYLLNDDSPIIREIDGRIWVYGSPWSGKTACYINERHPLKGCIRLSQGPENKIFSLKVLQAYAALHPSCPPTFAYDPRLYDCISELISTIISSVPACHLSCRPDKEAAEMAFSNLFL